MLYYSKTTNGFYHEELTPTLPSDAVAITEEVHQALLAGQAEGRVLTSDANGHPLLVVVERSAEELRQQLLSAARLRLTASDIVVLRLVEHGLAVPENYRAYREALRAVLRGEQTTLPTEPGS